MYLLIIVLKKEALLKKVISIFLECGFFDTTILDGEGIENIAGATTPLFNEITKFFGLELIYNRAIVSSVPTRNDLVYFIKLCREEGIDFNDSEIGVLMALPLEFYTGNL